MELAFSISKKAAASKLPSTETSIHPNLFSFAAKPNLAQHLLERGQLPTVNERCGKSTKGATMKSTIGRFVMIGTMATLGLAVGTSEASAQSAGEFRGVTSQDVANLPNYGYETLNVDTTSSHAVSGDHGVFSAGINSTLTYTAYIYNNGTTSSSFVCVAYAQNLATHTLFAGTPVANTAIGYSTLTFSVTTTTGGVYAYSIYCNIPAFNSNGYGILFGVSP